MDLTDIDDPFLQASLRLHHGMRHHGPGSAETTRLLLSLAGPLPPRPRVADLGCGSGAATLVLAEETDAAEITAVDIYEPFLGELRDAAASAGIGDRIRTEARSIDDLAYPDGAFDLVWSEGAAYNIGFDSALRQWRRLLAPGGALVVTECGWTTDRPAPQAREFWDEMYPLRSTAENVAAATAAGYTVEAVYLLPDRDWFDEYYTVLERRVAAIDPGDEAMVRAGAAQQREIDLRRAHGGDYGYAGYVLRRRS
ncbi:class I SAM-dependent methyltransferase [Streptomonospora litoralis]|uniref:Glycine/sarcosine/dimethylglycine N-methyltransferase n=1 Tax=Streptomonospora litoralis TaxID=2498135 RepID=A0A4P6Q9H7_9ACTN|nr:class I SAM-dependent methyltransferase [Streptomonospora litoralis]QBI56271.1 Glycine/sarcosine/dimethylglycine N-methyltransferase [Streptomonospora litoralis]